MKLTFKTTMEINGTYYTKDCIKVIERIVAKGDRLSLEWEFGIKIVIGVHTSTEYKTFDSESVARQSRKQLIEQLNK